MNKFEKNFLFKYLNNYSPVGSEFSGQRIWLLYLKSYVDDFFTDVYGNAVGIINPNSEYKVVIEAHSDEISWMINYITKDGYMYVVRNGGSDYEIAPSMRANIHTENGLIPAIFGWPAIHVRDKKSITPSISTVVLDCGCNSDKEVEKMGIHVGSIVTFKDDLFEMNNNFLVGRALDNRIGGFMIAQVAAKIKKNKIKLPFSLYIVNSVQEEVGLRGASMIANRIKPNLAIITDVTHDTQSPLYSKIKDGNIKSGMGPVLSYAPSVQNNVLKMLIKIAKSNNIPFQRLASSRYTGTDTDAFAYSNTGVASGLVSLPLKYMHTTVEMVNKNDVNNVIELMYSFLVNLKLNYNFSYFK